MKSDISSMLYPFLQSLAVVALHACNTSDSTSKMMLPLLSVVPLEKLAYCWLSEWLCNSPEYPQLTWLQWLRHVDHILTSHTRSLFETACFILGLYLRQVLLSASVSSTNTSMSGWPWKTCISRRQIKYILPIRDHSFAIATITIFCFVKFETCKNLQMVLIYTGSISRMHECLLKLMQKHLRLICQEQFQE